MANCPICRADWKKFVPQIDRDKQIEIALAYEPRFMEKKRKMEQEGLWFDNKLIMKFMYGNTHQHVQNEKWVRILGQNRRLQHRWCMFVALNTGLQETARFIKSVTYHL